MIVLLIKENNTEQNITFRLEWRMRWQEEYSAIVIRFVLFIMENMKENIDINSF